MASLCALILTFNESKHLRRCIESLQSIADEIVVVDSFSADDTVEIARSMGALVHQHAFVNHAAQLNWALETVPIQSAWTLRIDADEYLTPALSQELGQALDNAPLKVSGWICRRGVTFLRQPLRFGGFSGHWVLRCWRTGLARCESRWMDEHMLLQQGQAKRLRQKLIDDNLNDIDWWMRKHLGYAAREAVDLLNLRHRFLVKVDPPLRSAGLPAATKRWLKERFYSRMPLGIRPVLYYLYRMLFQLGILDGPKGWAFHFLQGLWYRSLVDIRVWEVETAMRDQALSVEDAIRDVLKIDVAAFPAAQ